MITELIDIYKKATVVKSGVHWTTINSFTDQVTPLNPKVLIKLSKHISSLLNRKNEINLIVGEEDKGAHIATAVSLELDIPITLARWYPYHGSFYHPSSVIVPLQSEYFSGKLLLNGVSSSSKILIVDDTISSGGTIIALINAIKSRKAEIIDAFAIVEKVGMGGVDNVLKETGVNVNTLLKIIVTEEGVAIKD